MASAYANLEQEALAAGATSIVDEGQTVKAVFETIEQADAFRRSLANRNLLPKMHSVKVKWYRYDTNSEAAL